MAAPVVVEVLPPILDSTSDSPPLFDGTTRLYINDMCPYAQRVWIVRNYKLWLYDKIKLVPIDLQNMPAWYKEKVYPENKVPLLEHNGQVIGESLDLVKYIDSNFIGPALLPYDPAKQKFAEELIAYSDNLIKKKLCIIQRRPSRRSWYSYTAEFDYLETGLHKFEDGPFFLGQFSQVDVVYAQFVERFKVTFQVILKHYFMAGRPKLAAWIEAINKIDDAYKLTKCDPERLVTYMKKRYLGEVKL